MITHQTNHLRIQQLRQTTDALDSNIRSTIQLLASTRRDIASIPSTTSADGQTRQEIKVDDLLAYAKFISKTTVPPTARKHDLPLLPAKSEPGAAAAAQITNGIATPPAGAADDVPHTQPENIGVKAMSAEQKESLNPTLSWTPWPDHDVIAAGALMEIQRMVESGQDPGSVLTAEEQAERERGRKEEEEKEKVALEERERRRMSLFDTSAMRRRTAYEDVFDPDDE